MESLRDMEDRYYSPIEWWGEPTIYCRCEPLCKSWKDHQDKLNALIALDNDRWYEEEKDRRLGLCE